MDPSTNIEDSLECIENFLAWKYRIGLILKENGLEKYIKDEIAEPKEDEAKEKHEQDLIKEIRCWCVSTFLPFVLFLIVIIKREC